MTFFGTILWRRFSIADDIKESSRIVRLEGGWMWSGGNVTREGLGRSDDEEMLWVWCGDDCLEGTAARRWCEWGMYVSEAML